MRDFARASARSSPRPPSRDATCTDVHFLRNALDHLPRKPDDDCLQELCWLGACPWAGQRPYPRDRRSVEARRDLSTWISKRGARYQKPQFAKLDAHNRLQFHQPSRSEPPRRN